MIVKLCNGFHRWQCTVSLDEFDKTGNSDDTGLLYRSTTFEKTHHLATFLHDPKDC